MHKQSWAQQVLVAASRLGVPLGEVRSMSPGILLTIQEELTGRWREDMGECAIPNDICTGLEHLRSLGSEGTARHGWRVCRRRASEHTWAVCRSDVLANQALFQTGIPCGDSEERKWVPASLCQKNYSGDIIYT